MKSVLFLYTGNDSSKAKKLKDYLQGRLRKVANMRNIIDLLAEEQDFMKVLRRSDCVVLIGTRLALSLIQNKQQETDDDFITFDGKGIHNEFTENKELVKDKLIIVFFTERTKNDWIPTGFNERRIFHVEDGNVHPDGSPTLAHLEYCMKKILIGESLL